VRAALLAFALLIAPQQATPPTPDTTAQKDATAPTRPSFSEWLAGVRAEALERGIRPEIVDEALGNLTEPTPSVLERDRTQAETVLTLEQYVSRLLTPKYLARAREAAARERALVREVATAYGVPPGIIVGIWGIESNFGGFSGVRPTVAALATLAWDTRRPTFFRRELFNALEILNRGDIEPSKMRGSWAGAMGQVQFMPSSYLDYAEDFDGDGKRDIWSSHADVFASIANYLQGHGWMPGKSWGREVILSTEAEHKVASDVERRNGSCQATRDMTVALPMERWEELGVRLPGGKPLPKSEEPVALVSGSTRHFLVTRNYDAILEYNCSHSYAVTVGLLADRLDGAPASSSSTAKARSSSRRAPGTARAR
jgi:membrane-bound lytic murein transglycosylase B